jgi:hypothetical protein
MAARPRSACFCFSPRDSHTIKDAPPGARQVQAKGSGNSDRGAGGQRTHQSHRRRSGCAGSAVAKPCGARGHRRGLHGRRSSRPGEREHGHRARGAADRSIQVRRGAAPVVVEAECICCSRGGWRGLGCGQETGVRRPHGSLAALGTLASRGRRTTQRQTRASGRFLGGV